ncbi:MAG TPA: DMT family transporter [Thermoleophilaceae bacterium]|nr:DMT family transporter [Thermoleophilaceae bacterium]
MTSGRSPVVGTIALLAAAASIGAGAIAVRAAFDHGAEAGPLVAVRFIGAGLLFCLVLPWLLARGPRPLPWRGMAFAVAAGLTLLVGARAEFEGLARLPAAVLVLLLFVAPIWVALIERILWRRPVARATILAIALVIVGVTTMVAPWHADVDLVGVAFGLVGSVALAAFFVLMEHSQQTTPTSLAISAALVAAGAVSFLLDPGALTSELGDSGVMPYAAAIAAAFAAWGLLASIGLDATTAVTAAIVSASEPVFVALLAFVLLGESLSAREIGGGAVVMTGVLLGALGPTLAARRPPPQEGALASSR